MGSCVSKETQKYSIATSFQDTFTKPENAQVFRVTTGCFTDLWDMIHMDWSNKMDMDDLKDKLHYYLKSTVCSEPNIVLKYKGKIWMFEVEYCNNYSKYRIITIN
jgi:hypothetical protein